ncbi:MAG: hypothetical protein CMH34_01705 [Microbacterium sp.]|nr:hypothetical protein [Microbacterium sp.]
MQFLILGMLMLAPMSLYDVHKQFTAGASLFYSASFGSIQRALARLSADGLVSVREEPVSARGRKVHAATPSGVAAWREWMRTPGEGANPERVMLAKVYLLGLMPAGSQRDEVLDMLRASAAAARAELEAVERALDAQPVPEGYREIFAYQRATLDYGLRAHRLACEWLDELT